MNSDYFKQRTKAFALRIIRLAESLPDMPTARVIRNRISELLKEADEILSIVVSSIKTARGRKKPIRTPQSQI